MSRKRKAPREQKLSADDRAFLDGHLSAFSDFSDGAWQAACEAAIAECDRFKDSEPYDVWLDWATKGAA